MTPQKNQSQTQSQIQSQPERHEPSAPHPSAFSPSVFPIFYATHDGHTARVAARMAEEMTRLGVASIAWDLGAKTPTAPDIPPHPFPVFLIAPIRYGFHLPAANRFLRTHKPRLAQGPLFLVSVNLTARKQGKKSPEGNVYLRKWIRKHKLAPHEARAFAGQLDYPRYGFFDRTMIRLIMTITGGPTDPSCVIDYTPWAEVDALAQKLAALFEEQRLREEQGLREKQRQGS